MRLVEEELIQTVHLYVVPEDQLPPRKDYAAIIITTLCSLFLISVITISMFAPTSSHEVSFLFTVQGYSLAPVSKTIKISVQATGKVHVAATTAIGTITFYNGAIYSQIIPVNTILKGADGISVMTDEQATIPAAEQTIPPTYGQITVLAHSMMSGTSGNINAGDINEACCASSVIVQNSSFHGGKDAYVYTYLSEKDVQDAISPHLPTLQIDTLSLLPRLHLNPICSTTTTSTPRIGEEIKSAVVKITETCKAFSYSLESVKDAISTYSRHFKTGTLTHVHFIIIEVTNKKGVGILLYVTATWNPIVMHRFPTGK